MSSVFGLVGEMFRTVAAVLAFLVVLGLAAMALVAIGWIVAALAGVV